MNIYAQRRERLLKQYPNNVCVILYSGLEVMRSEDESYPFDVNRNFFYLTGLERENMILMMYKIDDVINETIFALPYSEFASKWYGDRMSFNAIKEISEIKNVQECAEFDDVLASLHNRTRRDPNFEIALDLWRYTAEQADSQGIKLAKKIKELYPSIKVSDVYPEITKFRLIKDEYEVACVRQAIATTKVAHESMMKNIRPEMNEMMMEAVFDYSLMTRMCNKEAFGIICASGKRATVLHYRDNNQTMKDGELFLCDMGATYSNYCADISRTFPVNGKFTERQKEIYNIVLRAQSIVQENAKVGVKIRDLNNMVLDYYRAELPRHGLTKDVREYYWHNISHHLGLDTHDADGGLGQTLQAGNIISNEPGLYIEEEGIGIRIEDDLLITGTGCENLAKDLLHTPEEIEEFMANNR